MPDLVMKNVQMNLYDRCYLWNFIDCWLFAVGLIRWFTWQWRPCSVDWVVLSTVGCRVVVNRVAVSQGSSWHRDDDSFAWIACDSNVLAVDCIHLQEVVIFPTSKYLQNKRNQKKLNRDHVNRIFAYFTSLSLYIVLFYHLSGIT